MKEQLELAEFLMPPHPLTNFEIQKYYKKEPKFNGVYLGNNLSKIETNIYSIQAYDSIICGYFCIGFIDFMLKEKSIQFYFLLMIMRRMIK